MARIMSAAARAAESKRMTGRKHPHKGHAMTSATRAKLSAARKGKAHPHKGHALTAETRAKIAAALRAHYAALTPRGKRATRAVAGGRRPRAVSLRRPATARGDVSHAPKLARAHRTHKFRHGAHRLISSHTYHKRTGLIHSRRKHRTRIKIHRTVRHHRVWRARRRK